MTDESILPEVLAPYAKTVRVWSGISEVTQGSRVQPIGMVESYSIRLSAPAGADDRFIWVQQLTVAALMAHQPMTRLNVFDAQGRYLGQGGDALADLTMSPVVPLTEVVSPRRAPRNSVIPSPPLSEASSITYPFPLRRGHTVRLILPEDLTKEEVARLVQFLLALPTEKS
jgi:hypothetical protein